MSVFVKCFAVCWDAAGKEDELADTSDLEFEAKETECIDQQSRTHQVQQQDVLLADHVGRADTKAEPQQAEEMKDFEGSDFSSGDAKAEPQQVEEINDFELSSFTSGGASELKGSTGLTQNNHVAALALESMEPGSAELTSEVLNGGDAKQMTSGKVHDGVQQHAKTDQAEGKESAVHDVEVESAVKLLSMGITITKYHRKSALTRTGQRTACLVPDCSELLVSSGKKSRTYLMQDLQQVLNDRDGTTTFSFGADDVLRFKVRDESQMRTIVHYFRWRLDACQALDIRPGPLSPIASGTVPAVPDLPDVAPAFAAAGVAAMVFEVGSGIPVVAPLFSILSQVQKAYDGARRNRKNLNELVELCNFAVRGLSAVSAEQLTGKEDSIEDLQKLFEEVLALANSYGPEGIVKTLFQMVNYADDKEKFASLHRRITGATMMATLEAVLKQPAPPAPPLWTDDMRELRQDFAVKVGELGGLSEALSSHASEIESILSNIGDLPASLTKLLEQVEGVSDEPWEMAHEPRGAPELPRQYVERQEAVARLVCELLEQHNPFQPLVMASLAGMGGVGKTVLARSVVRRHDIRRRFKDGIIWVKAWQGSKDNLLPLLQSIAEQFYFTVVRKRLRKDRSEPPDDYKDSAQAVNYITRYISAYDLSCLLVVDNLWEAEVLDQLRGSGFHLLVTTRNVALAGSSVLELGRLTDAEAIHLLKNSARLEPWQWADGAPPAAREVAKQCGNLAIALAMAGSLPQVKCQSSEDKWRVAVRMLSSALDVLSLKEGSQTLAAVLRVSFDALAPETQPLYLLLAVLPNGFPADAEMLVSLWDCSADAVGELVELLVSRSLLERQEAGVKPHDTQAAFIGQEIKLWHSKKLAGVACGRQSAYLSDLRTLRHYGDVHDAVRGRYGLLALWHVVEALSGHANAAASGYKRSLTARRAENPPADVLVHDLQAVADFLGVKGAFDPAVELYKEALRLRTASGAVGGADLATTLNNLAGLLESQGKYEEAKPLYERAIAIGEKMLGPEHPDLATWLNNLAGLLYHQGQYDDAKPLYERSLAITEKALGAEHPDVAESLNNLAHLLVKQGKYGEAEPLYRRAITIWEKALGAEHPNVASGLNNLAELLRAQGKYDEAMPLYERSLAIREKALGPEHPDVAGSLNNLALLLSAQGKYGEAEPLYRRANTIWEKALGPEHPELAKGLNNLAGLLKAQGKYLEAEPLYRRANTILEKALGAEHPTVASGLNNLAVLLESQGKYDEAEPLYRRAIEIDQKALGPDHPELATDLNNLAGLLSAQGKYEEAEGPYRRALAIFEATLGGDHPKVATNLNNLAEFLRAQGKYDEAELLYEMSLAISEKALGAEHPDVAQSLNNLARLLSAQGKFEEAEGPYRRALAIFEATLGADHPNVATNLNILAELLRAQGKYSEVEPLYRRANTIWEKALGAEHPELAKGLNNLAQLLRSQGKGEEAEPMLQRAVDIGTKSLGPGLPHVEIYRKSLAFLRAR